MQLKNLRIEKYGHKVGRNEKCPCGSGKKYKSCCYEKDKDEEIKKNRGNE